jgi:polysaccharide deacetylase family protein (PEP-CTERM system associated)
MQNALTIDLEDYFHVSAYADGVRPQDWDSFPSRVAQTTDRLLQLLDRHKFRATFFVLGWVAEKKPELVARVASAGHEIACHSFWHRRVFDLSPREFREDTLRAKRVIEDVTGKQVVGYRAPSFSVTAASTWALDILVETGFQYDSSIYPVEHPSYGMPAAPRDPFWIKTPSGPILEFPMTTLQVAGRRSPVAGGAYLRLLPYVYTRWAVNYLNRIESRPACVYLHPWELDAAQPVLPGRMSSHLRHRFGLRGLGKKLDRLLSDFTFVPLGNLVAEINSTPDGLTDSLGIDRLSDSSRLADSHS